MNFNFILLTCVSQTSRLKLLNLNFVIYKIYLNYTSYNYYKDQLEKLSDDPCKL